MLAQNRMRRPKANSRTARNPRRFTRYFTILILLFLLSFISTLTGLGWSSNKSVQQGVAKAPPPPPVWESFPFLKRYHGGLRSLVPRSQNVPEYPGKDGDIPETPVKDSLQSRDDRKIARSEKLNPYPEYSSEEYKSNHNQVHECFLDAEETIRVPSVRVFSGVVEGMPDNVLGSYELLNLREDVCFERFGRLGPYGLGYGRKLGGTGAGMEGHTEGADLVWKEDPEVDFRKVNWAEAQERCEKANVHRFAPKEKENEYLLQDMSLKEETDEEPHYGTHDSVKRSPSNSTDAIQETPTSKGQLSRNVVLIRTWSDYNYDEEDLLFLRALVSELSILSGGEFSVHFLVHVKDHNLPIWADTETYQRVLKESLPEEFHGMGTLWSEKQMGLIYGGLPDSFYRDLPVHGAYRSSFMPVQYFAHQHPEYDFFWQWEMDVRYTGHYYHLLSNVANWAKQQPRKFLWERNSRFYVPSEHGSWEDFTHMVRVQTEHGTSSKSNMWNKPVTGGSDLDSFTKNIPQPEQPIWGPERPLDDEFETGNDPVPPTPAKEDDYEWGAGEEADLITFNPLFDPSGTDWLLTEDITGYNTTRGDPPRRAAIVTTGRLSRRLLETMHRETALKQHTMFTEMWPATCALHHGLKAVYAPHPVYIDRRWPTDYLSAVFNGGKNGASGGARLSVFSEGRQHNLMGTTWYYNAGFAPNLWKRWLGYKVDNDGGEEWELANEGRMCLPAMLLHPVKQVDLII